MFAFKGVVGCQMVYLDVALTNLAVCLAEVETAADATDMASPQPFVVFDALAAQLWIALFLCQIVLMLQSFCVWCIVGIIVGNGWLWVVGHTIETLFLFLLFLSRHYDRSGLVL